ncbi:hypothetical protein HanIR_Chr01g0012301 [Helianthus annuus]|nr:hypothetical protein HanIR_Chr01g0012301 [Helianthus annuus]
MIPISTGMTQLVVRNANFTVEFTIWSVPGTRSYRESVRSIRIVDRGLLSDLCDYDHYSLECTKRRNMLKLNSL